jgi:hypothetical protein
MDDLAKLMAIEEIKKLKGRYVRALDAGRWDEFANCLAADFAVWETGLTEELSGRDVVVAQARHSFETHGRWKHHAILPDIEIMSDTTAKGVWTVASFDGIYEDEYVKIDGQWKVRRARVTLSEAYAQEVIKRRGGNR